MQNDSQKGILGSRFEQLSAAPTEGLWNSISATMDEKKKRRGFIWWWLGSGIAAIALVSIIVLYQAVNIDEGINVSANSKKQFFAKSEIQSQEQIRFSLKEPVGNEVQIIIAANPSSIKNQNDLSYKEDLNPIKLKQSKNGLINSEELTVMERNLSLTLFKEDVEKMQIKSPQIINNSEDQNALEKVDIIPNKQHKWELGVGINAWGTYTSLPATDMDQFIEDTTSTDILDSPGLNYESKLNRPFGVIFHVGYHLNSRVRLISGLNFEFTRFSSVNGQGAVGMNEATGLTIKTVNQYLIALPLGIECDIVGTNRFQAGAGIHILNEFPIIERYSPFYTAIYAGKKYKETNFITGYQLGFQPNLNFTYSLNEKMKIQANPGMRWYAFQFINSSAQLSNRKIWFGGTLKLVCEL